jgi:hypothetical protein
MIAGDEGVRMQREAARLEDMQVQDARRAEMERAEDERQLRESERRLRQQREMLVRQQFGILEAEKRQVQFELELLSTCASIKVLILRVCDFGCVCVHVSGVQFVDSVCHGKC